jgi:6,7-dimethyl-8-ribityllumazine synthase
MAVFEGTFSQSSQFRFALVIGRFNDLVTGKLLEGCQDCLKRHGIDVDPNGIRSTMPGCRAVLRSRWWPVSSP